MQTSDQQQTSSESSFTQDMGVAQQQQPAVNPLDVLVPEDSLVADMEDEGVDMKSNAEFRLVFKRAEGKKKLPLSDLAVELVTKVNFTRMLGVPIEAAGEEAPKRRGRKPRAESESAKGKVINIEFIDDPKNVAIDFIESLASYEGFRVFLFVQDDDGVDVERFTFKDVKIVPTSFYASFQSEHAASGLRLQISLAYGSMARKSLVTESGEEASGE